MGHDDIRHSTRRGIIGSVIFCRFSRKTKNQWLVLLDNCQDLSMYVCPEIFATDFGNQTAASRDRKFFGLDLSLLSKNVSKILISYP